MRYMEYEQISAQASLFCALLCAQVAEEKFCQGIADQDIEQQCEDTDRNTDLKNIAEADEVLAGMHHTSIG